MEKGDSMITREVMSIIYQFRDSDEPEQELNMWDVDCALWLSQNAHQCRTLKVEPLKWEPIVDTMGGVAIAIIKNRAKKSD
jgi:hypothetical protein